MGWHFHTTKNVVLSIKLSAALARKKTVIILALIIQRVDKL